jgi:hypothetical protein
MERHRIRHLNREEITTVALFEFDSSTTQFALTFLGCVFASACPNRLDASSPTRWYFVFQVKAQTDDTNADRKGVC